MTEIRVSITDHVLMVSQTVIPKYSLTSQKRASLTWEKNRDPAPTDSTIRASWAGGRLDASGATMPAAVTVATVADPVATRINTATIHPSRSADRLAATATLPMATPGAAVDQHLFEASPGTDDQQHADDGQQAGTDLLPQRRCRESHGRPEGDLARSTATSSATTGSPRKLNTL